MNLHDNCYICDERATTKYCGKKMCLACAQMALDYANLMKEVFALNGVTESENAIRSFMLALKKPLSKETQEIDHEYPW